MSPVPFLVGRSQQEIARVTCGIRRVIPAKEAGLKYVFGRRTSRGTAVFKSGLYQDDQRPFHYGFENLLSSSVDHRGPTSRGNGVSEFTDTRFARSRDSHSNCQKAGSQSRLRRHGRGLYRPVEPDQAVRGVRS